MSSARRRRAHQGSRQKNRQASPDSRIPSPRRVFLVPLALTLGLAMLSFVPRVSGNPILAGSFWGAAIVLLVWQAALFLRLKGVSEGRSLHTVLRPRFSLAPFGVRPSYCSSGRRRSSCGSV